jgi:spermidine synthase
VLLALGGALAGLSVPTLAALGPGSGSLGLAIAACAPAMLALGAAFPLLVHLLSPAAGRVGRSVGGAAAALDLGSVAGPVLGALVLLPLLGTKWTLVALGAAAVIVAAALAFWASRHGARLGLAGRWLVILALPAAVLPAARAGLYGPKALKAAAGAGREVTVDTQDEGLEAVVTVAEVFEPWEDRTVRQLFIGHKMQADDTTPWLRVEKRMGALPALLCPATSGRSLHIGLGSGITAAWSAAAAPGRTVECAELVPGVARAQEFFRPHNSRGPVTVTVADGRARLLQERGKFELIVTDIVFPEDAGAGGLFSVEYFRLAKSRLAEGGLFAQWIPLFQLPPEAFAAVVRAFQEVFPDATLWAGCLDAYRPVVMLLGSRGEPAGALDPGALAARIAAAKLRPAELAGLGLGSPEGVLAHRIAGPERMAELAQGALL